MNARCEELAKIIDAARDEMTINEPEDSKRVRMGLMDPPAGAYNQFFTSCFFCDGEARGLGTNLNMLDHCLRNDKFTMEQIRIVASYVLPFSGEYLGYAGLRTVWEYVKEFLELLNIVEDKKDIQGLCRSLMIYVNYMHAWTHLMAPWGAGGHMYNFPSKEENEDVSEFYIEEDALKKHYPLDRGQIKF